MGIKQRIIRIFWTFALLLAVWVFIIGVEIIILVLFHHWTPR